MPKSIKQNKPNDAEKNFNLIFYPLVKGNWCYPSTLLGKIHNKITKSAQKFVKQKRFSTQEDYHQFAEPTNLPTIHHSTKMQKSLTKEHFKNISVLQTQPTKLDKNKSIGLLNGMKDQTQSIQMPVEKRKQIKSIDRIKKKISNEGRRTEMEIISPVTIKRSKTEMKNKGDQKDNKLNLIISKKKAVNRDEHQILADKRKQSEILKKYELFLGAKMKVPDKPDNTIPNITINPFRPPLIPSPPRKNQSTSEYIELANQIAKSFELKFNEFEVVLRRYKNCISFEANGKTIIWYFQDKIFVGDWKEIDKEKGQGLKEGNGFEKNINYYYLGQYQNSKKHGQGTILHDNGNVYEGQWKDGKMDGEGIFYDKKTHAYYQGTWDSNNLEGDGKVKYSKQHYFSGKFRRSKKEGQGLQFYENGDIYEGEYVSGRPSGKGRYFHKNGDVYIGQFQGGKKHGVGLYYQNSEAGSIIKQFYLGQFYHNQKSGYGIEKMSDGCIFKGYYYKGKRNGPGFLQKINGVTIKGVWSEGSFEEVNRNIFEIEK